MKKLLGLLLLVVACSTETSPVGRSCFGDSDCGDRAHYYCNGRSTSCGNGYYVYHGVCATLDHTPGGTCVTNTDCANYEACTNGTCGMFECALTVDPATCVPGCSVYRDNISHECVSDSQCFCTECPALDAAVAE